MERENPADFFYGVLTGIFSVIITLAVVVAIKFWDDWDPNKKRRVDRERYARALGIEITEIPHLDDENKDIVKDSGTHIKDVDDEDISNEIESLDEQKAEVLDQTEVLGKEDNSMDVVQKERSPSQEGLDEKKGEIEALFDSLEQKRKKILVIEPPRSVIIGSSSRYARLDSYPSRSQEEKAAIFSLSERLCNRSYSAAHEEAQKMGYQLHVLYNGLSQKMPRFERSETVIGVRIKDPDFLNGIPSKNAIVTEIIDVGGVDEKDRGAIHF